MPHLDPPPTAAQLRARNAELDLELSRLLAQVSPKLLHRDFGDEWTLAHSLAHVAEFQAYFARQLSEWIDRQRTVMGRIAESDPDRNDALVRAAEDSLDELRERTARSATVLAGVLERLGDEHLTQSTSNVKYGDEPLSAYLDRYVVGHKAAHTRQLRDGLRRASSGSSG